MAGDVPRDEEEAAAANHAQCRTSDRAHPFLYSQRAQTTGQSSDVIRLRFNGTETKVSKLFLAASSGYFRALLQHDPNRQEVCLETIAHDAGLGGLSGEEATALSSWMLPGGGRLLPHEDVPDMFRMADYLDLEELRQRSLEELKAATDIDDGSIAIRLSYFYSDLQTFANSFVEYNFVSLCACETWLDVPSETLLRLLGQPSLDAPCEDFIWEVIWTWAERDFDSRKQHVPELLRSTLRLGLMRRSTFLRMLDHCSGLQLSAQDWAVLDQVKVFQDWKQSTSQFAVMPELPSSIHMTPRLPATCVIATGGFTEGNPSSRMEFYDPAHGVWYELDLSLPVPNAYHGTVVLRNELISLGGFDERHSLTNLRTAYALDLETLTWRELPPMHSRRKFVMAVALEGCVYAIGGNDGFSANRRNRSCERFNPDTNQWEEVARMKCQRSDGDALVHEDQIWVVGGFDSSRYMRAVETYCVELNKWKERPKLQVARGGVKCAVLNNKLYAIGGYDGTTRLRSVESLDLDDIAAGWKIEPSQMHTGRSNFGVYTVGGKIFVAGGYVHPSYTNDVEWFDGVAWHKTQRFLRDVSGPSLVLVERSSSLKSRLRTSDLEDFIRAKRQKLTRAAKKNPAVPPEELARLQVHTFDGLFVESHPADNYLRKWSKCTRLLGQLVKVTRDLMTSMN